MSRSGCCLPVLGNARGRQSAFQGNLWPGQTPWASREGWDVVGWGGMGFSSTAVRGVMDGMGFPSTAFWGVMAVWDAAGHPGVAQLRAWRGEGVVCGGFPLPGQPRPWPPSLGATLAESSGRGEGRQMAAGGW